MDIKSGTSVAVVVNQSWANITAVRYILRADEPNKEIRGGSDTGHLILARVRDANDPLGLWIDNSGKHEADPQTPLTLFFIPWSQILTLATSKKAVPALWKKNARIGFVSDLT